MKVFAIIVIYNGLRNQWIEKCFNSLLNSSVHVDIIAIDNLSNDKSVDFIKNKYPFVEIIENGINLGFGKANNIGIEIALKKNADFIFLLNQDAWIQENTIEVLIQNSIKYPQYGIISPLHMNGNGDLIDQGFYNCINPFDSRKLYSLLFTKKYSKDTVLEFNFVPAACWLMPISTIMNIGGFSPTFYHYAEDDNYVDRMRFHGLKIGISPSVLVYHDREERPQNSLYDSHFKKYERKIILDISNPLSKGNVKFIRYRWLLLDFFNAILFKDVQEFKIIYKKLKILFKIKPSKYQENKIYSKTKGPNFLK